MAAAHQNGLIPALAVLPVPIRCQPVNDAQGRGDYTQESVYRLQYLDRSVIYQPVSKAEGTGRKLQQPMSERMFKKPF